LLELAALAVAVFMLPLLSLAADAVDFGKFWSVDVLPFVADAWFTAVAPDPDISLLVPFMPDPRLPFRSGPVMALLAVADAAEPLSHPIATSSPTQDFSPELLFI
jgi:hypothetical protein